MLQRVCNWIAYTVLAGCVVTGSVCAEGLGGITIIELTERDFGSSITGRPSSGDHLVLFATKDRSYAALITAAQRKCVAWAEGDATASVVHYGLPVTQQTIGLVSPPVCMPFTVELLDDSRVKLSSANPFSSAGPLNVAARPRDYAGTHRILARIPLTPVDWQQEMYRSHTINDVPLGLLPSPQGTALNWSTRRPSYRGTSSATFTLRGDQEKNNDKSVFGTWATAEALGWPADALYAIRTGKHFKEPTLTAVFDEVILERYGPPSYSKTRTQQEYYWLFDTQGAMTNADLLGKDTCSSTLLLWFDEDDLTRIDNDIGPWGCGLVLRLRHNGMLLPKVTNYQVFAINGYVQAMLHFRYRFDELETIKQQLSDTSSFKPTL